jgi:citrate-Mg2+:H+ or citrate-Ca2+:H+ symporter, CitMHS family
MARSGLCDPGSLLSVLSVFGFSMVIVFMILIMTRRASPMVALIGVPILFAFIAGFGGAELGDMMLKGIQALAPTGVMLLFAILYFAVMIDAGLFDPIVAWILGLVGRDPLKVMVGTAVLAAVVSLDGDGTTTYMITVASLLPLYQRLGMDPLKLTCVTMLASGVMNLTPWGGPLARAASALGVDPSEVFVGMMPAMACGLAGVVALAHVLGMSERRRLGELSLPAAPLAARPIEDVALLPSHSDDGTLRRPKLIWFNALLTATLMVALIAHWLPMSVLFMVGLAIALVVNYPRVEDQRRRIADNAKNVLAVVSLIFAAGVFTGILTGTGMIDAMSNSFLAIIPDGWGAFLAPITALVSLPFTYFLSNDAFYFGVLPIVADAAAIHGVDAVSMARASLVGQPIHLLSPLVPSTYLLVGLAGVEFGDHQRFALKWTLVVSLLIFVGALLTGAFPLMAG